jgi:hypothetical protein
MYIYIYIYIQICVLVETSMSYDYGVEIAAHRPNKKSDSYELLIREEDTLICICTIQY